MPHPEATSSAWTKAGPEISVVVATYRRPRELAELFASLGAQSLAWPRFEVVVVDDGDDEAIWVAVQTTVDRAPMAAAAIRQPRSRGPASARNVGVGLARGRFVAFTDDDCLPDPGWLAGLLQALAHADVVQGATAPPEGSAAAGAWDHAIWVSGPTPLFETCNLAVGRDWFERVGGFDERPLLAAGGGRHFGEDALLGGALVEAGARRAFAADAVVRHRWVSGSYRDYLRGRRKLEGFATLAGRSPVVRSSLTLGVFLSRRTAAYDAALTATAVWSTRPRRWWLLLAWLPWIDMAVPEARGRGRGARLVVRVLQLAVADGVGLASLALGSVRQRRLVV